MPYTGPAVSVYCMIGYHCTTAWPTARWRFIKYAFNLPLLTTTLTLPWPTLTLSLNLTLIMRPALCTDTF